MKDPWHALRATADGSLPHEHVGYDHILQGILVDGPVKLIIVVQHCLHHPLALYNPIADRIRIIFKIHLVIQAPDNILEKAERATRRLEHSASDANLRPHKLGFAELWITLPDTGECHVKHVSKQSPVLLPVTLGPLCLGLLVSDRFSILVELRNDKRR